MFEPIEHTVACYCQKVTLKKYVLKQECLLKKGLLNKKVCFKKMFLLKQK